MNKVYPKIFAVFSLFASWIIMSAPAFSQISLPGFGQKNASSNDQRAKNLLHQHLPLDLDANAAYPTVPNEDLLGGPFQGRVLPITVDTLTKPLPPGDYVLPMTFFCSEYSIHRPGAGTAYVLAPAKGTAAKAISTLLWRGMLTGHKPQELQSVSWAIQGSVPYDKMPANYRRLIDQLIPDMKNQVNGQAFADIEDGFQGKVNRVTRRISEGISKGTGGFVHADIKVDIELNESFQRLGRLGKMALDGESINSIVTAAYPSDEAREQALYAGQGTQAPALPAANGPWSVKVPGVAYMRFVVHSGNLHGDNVMQIRILPTHSQAALYSPYLDGKAHLVLAQYSRSTPVTPSLANLFNGSVNQAALSQCHASDPDAQMCVVQAITVGGDTAYPVGDSQVPDIAPAQSLPPTSPPTQQMCVKKALYEPTRLASGNLGLCIYLAAVANVGNSCGDSQTVDVPSDQKLNWVQTYMTNIDESDKPGQPPCTVNKAHKDRCENVDNQDVKLYGPLYRSDTDPDPSPKGKNDLYVGGFAFNNWKEALRQQGGLQLLFRDIPNRSFDESWFSGPLSKDALRCRLPKLADQPFCQFRWSTAAEDSSHPTVYEQPVAPENFNPLNSSTDNHLRLVRYASQDNDPNHFDYTPLIEITYGYKVDRAKAQVTVNPLYIGGRRVDEGGIISLDHIRKIGGRPLACTVGNPMDLGDPPLTFTPFPYDSR